MIRAMDAKSGLGEGARPLGAAPDPRRMRRRMVVLLLCVLAGPVLAELGLRFLLFHPSELAAGWGADLRDARRYAVPSLEDEYWRLLWKLEPDLRKHPKTDELTGWVKGEIEPGSYRNDAARELRGRRPILLFGASYANCLTPARSCFQGILERSDLAEEFGLVNYGVGGYGVDQTYLLMRESLDLYENSDPVVVIGVVADSDFERASLRFRDWPKPRLQFVDGALSDGERVTRDAETFLDEEGTGIGSYAWRLLLHSPSLPLAGLRSGLTGIEEKRREQNELLRGIVLAIRDELEARGLHYYFLLFVSPRGLPPAGVPKTERMLVRLFEESEVPYVHTRSLVLAAAETTGRGIAPLFVQSGPKLNHPTAAGNEVLFEALRDGLEGRYSKESPRARPHDDSPPR